VAFLLRLHEACGVQGSKISRYRARQIRTPTFRREDAPAADICFDSVTENMIIEEIDVRDCPIRCDITWLLLIRRPRLNWLSRKPIAKEVDNTVELMVHHSFGMPAC
jgi:hypothetical protein